MADDAEVRRTDVVVIGAGISGLLAATEVAGAGRSVVVVDRGRRVGGRMATRRIPAPGAGEARVDHGAQFFTVRTERFDDFVQPLVAGGLVHVWTHGFDAAPDGHPRYAVRGGMTALAERVAQPLDVEVRCRIDRVRVGDDGSVAVAAADGRRWRTERVIVTSPVPQSIALLGDDAPDGTAPLYDIAYAPTLCLFGLLDRDGVLPPHGARQRPDGTPFEFVADNAARRTSEVPALTAHLDGEESARRWNDRDEETIAAAVELVTPLLGGATVVDPQLERWRHATPVALHPEPCLVAGPLVFAGDAFGTPRVEGAATSGWAAAEAVLGS